MSPTLVRDSTQRMLEVNPSLTYAEIGRLLGVSRERIRQVAGTSRRRSRVCKVCGQSIQVRRNGVTQTAYRLCYCAECWTAAKQHRAMANRKKCICEVCGTAFWRTEGVVKRMKKRGYNVRWCSRQCHGKWLGANR